MLSFSGNIKFLNPGIHITISKSCFPPAFLGLYRGGAVSLCEGKRKPTLVFRWFQKIIHKMCLEIWRLPLKNLVDVNESLRIRMTWKAKKVENAQGKKLGQHSRGKKGQCTYSNDSRTVIFFSHLFFLRFYTMCLLF